MCAIIWLKSIIACLLETLLHRKRYNRVFGESNGESQEYLTSERSYTVSALTRTEVTVSGHEGEGTATMNLIRMWVCLTQNISYALCVFETIVFHAVIILTIVCRQTLILTLKRSCMYTVLQV